jgi:hypothetical protein
MKQDTHVGATYVLPRLAGQDKVVASKVPQLFRQKCSRFQGLAKRVVKDTGKNPVDLLYADQVLGRILEESSKEKTKNF